MKKVIKGRLCNTETAQKLNYWQNGLSSSDFSFAMETLYKSNSGQFFLHCEGGPSSRYAKHTGSNEWGFGETILALEYEQAKEWAEEKLSADEYLRIFEIEDNGKVTLNVSVNQYTKNKLEALRSETGKSISQLIEEKF